MEAVEEGGMKRGWDERDDVLEDNVLFCGCSVIVIVVVVSIVMWWVRCG